MPVADDELPGEVSRSVDGQRATPDQELVSSRIGQVNDDLLPPGQDRHDPGGRLPDAHENDAVPAGDIFRSDTGRPPPVQPRTGPKGDECLPGPKPGLCGLVLSVPPEQLQLFERIW